MKKGLFAAVFLLIASVAGADTFNLTGPYSFAYGGYVVGPVQGKLNGVTPLTVICNDFTDTSYIGSSWGVNISTIPSLTYAMYADHPIPTAGQVATYEQAAILLWQMNQPGNQTADGIGGLQYALWNIFNPAVPDPGTSASWVTWVQGQNLANWDYGGVGIYTDVDTVDPHNQEHMSGAASQVPEPATGTLVWAGGTLFALGWTFRWRRQKE